MPCLWACDQLDGSNKMLVHARTSECSEMTFESPGMDCRRERLELWPVPSTLPPRTSNEPCFVSSGDSSATSAANKSKRE